jgi:hypothetical protein
MIPRSFAASRTGEINDEGERFAGVEEKRVRVARSQKHANLAQSDEAEMPFGGAIRASGTGHRTRVDGE